MIYLYSTCRAQDLADHPNDEWFSIERTPRTTEGGAPMPDHGWLGYFSVYTVTAHGSYAGTAEARAAMETYVHEDTRRLEPEEWPEYLRQFVPIEVWTMSRLPILTPLEIPEAIPAEIYERVRRRSDYRELETLAREAVAMIEARTQHTAGQTQVYRELFEHRAGLPKFRLRNLKLFGGKR